LRAGRTYVPLGGEATRAYQIAAEQMPRLGAAYQRASEDLARADAHLAGARERLERLEVRDRPRIEELRQAGGPVQRIDLPERVLSLRPRDQITLARAYSPELLERAAERAPQVAGRTVAGREEWMQNLAPQLDRALDRQLSRHRVATPAPGRPPAEWMTNAVRQGLRPAHAIQALARAGVSLADTLRATSRALTLTRAAVGNPARMATTLAAKALGVPGLPVRLAVVALSLARRVGRALSR
jgi:hypothetical protein